MSTMHVQWSQPIHSQALRLSELNGLRKWVTKASTSSLPLLVCARPRPGCHMFYWACQGARGENRQPPGAPEVTPLNMLFAKCLAANSNRLKNRGGAHSRWQPHCRGSSCLKTQDYLDTTSTKCTAMQPHPISKKLVAKWLGLWHLVNICALCNTTVLSYSLWHCAGKTMIVNVYLLNG